MYGATVDLIAEQINEDPEKLGLFEARIAQGEKIEPGDWMPAEYRRQLMGVWQQANVSNERLVADLREWCARAEASGIAVLEEFSARLRGYIPQAVPVAV